MPQIASIDIPKDKRILISLTYIFGIGRSLSAKILSATGIDPDKKAKDLTAEEVNLLQNYVSNNIMVEGDLRRDISAHIQRLVSISCFRGIRHREGLPVRGQIARNKGGKRRERRRKRFV